MDNPLDDEVTSINAIYEPDTLSRTSESGQSYSLRIPETNISLRLSFPPEYPDIAPTVIGPEGSGTETKKGEAREIAEIASDILAATFKPGQPCVFEVLEELQAILQSNYSAESNPEDGGAADSDTRISDNNSVEAKRTPAVKHPDIPDPPWTLSEVVTEKKSTFVARVASVKSTTEAKSYIQHLVTTDKKAAKATHNITAWRIRDPGSPDVTFQDCDDDGENAAGGRLLHLLQLMDVWNCLVIVTRWFGGIHLGPDRFRIINSVARDAVVRGGFAESGNAEHANKKGK